MSQQLALLTSYLVRIAAPTLGPRVEVQNSSEATYAISSDGSQWVVRPAAGANEVLSEALYWLFSRDLGVPCADGAIWFERGFVMWASRLVVGVNHWSPDRADSLVNPAGLGAILALDAILGNFDRHAGNLLLATDDAGPHRLWVVGIDQADSWVGTPSDFDAHGVEPPPCANHARGIPHDLVVDGAMEAASKAARLDDDLIVGYVREAAMVTAEPQADILLSALRRRLSCAPAIVEQHLANLRGLR